MRLIILGLFLFVVSCAQLQQANQPQVVSQVKLSWEVNHPERAAWSQAIQANVNENLALFDKAQDTDKFASGYALFTKEKKLKFWGELILSVMYFESGYNPKSVYHEPAPLNVDSIGLLQLSYGDKYCPKSKAEGDLQDPIVNIKCGVKIMANLIDKYGAISTPGNKGAAAYWSTLRESRKLPQVIQRFKVNFQ